MTPALARIGERLPRIKRWAAVTLLTLLLVVVYSGYQGLRYYSATQDLDATDAEIGALGPQIGPELPPTDSIEDDLAVRKVLMEEWASVFSLGGFRLIITDDGGVVSSTVNHLGSISDGVKSVELDITPGVEYPFTVERTGSARHYKLVPSHPFLEVSNSQVRYLAGQNQEWGIKAGQDETVVLELGTDSASQSKGAPQADLIQLTVFDEATGSVMFGPTSTPLTLDSPATFTFANTSTPRDLRVSVTTNGHFHMRKVGGDRQLYVLPCVTEDAVEDELNGRPCTVGIFEQDDTHDWALRWATSTPPEAGKARLLIVAPKAATAQDVAVADSGQLMAEVTAIALESGVDLKSIARLDSGKQASDSLTFQTESLAISLSGERHLDFFEFLSRLRTKMPFASVSDFSMAGLGEENPNAKLVLIFYLAPDRSPEAGE